MFLFNRKNFAVCFYFNINSIKIYCNKNKTRHKMVSTLYSYYKEKCEGCARISFWFYEEEILLSLLRKKYANLLVSYAFCVFYRRQKEGFFYAQPSCAYCSYLFAANRRFEKELLSFILYAKLLVSYAFCLR